MNAIYKGKLYTLGENPTTLQLTDPETGQELSVSYVDPELILEPTDDQINNILPDANPADSMD